MEGRSAELSMDDPGESSTSLFTYISFFRSVCCQHNMVHSQNQQIFHNFRKPF